MPSRIASRARRAYRAFPRAVWLCVPLVAPAVLACGASVSRRYESDVRFERCLALDWQGSVDPVVRKRCWLEWSTYHADGQPHDRLDHARQSLASLEEQAQRGVEDRPMVATPDPTSAFAPPPMMFAKPDGGTPDAEPLSACESDCEVKMASCLAGCRGDACERSCTSRFVPCLKRCQG